MHCETDKTRGEDGGVVVLLINAKWTYLFVIMRCNVWRIYSKVGNSSRCSRCGLLSVCP